MNIYIGVFWNISLFELMLQYIMSLLLEIGVCFVIKPSSVIFFPGLVTHTGWRKAREHPKTSVSSTQAWYKAHNHFRKHLWLYHVQVCASICFYFCRFRDVTCKVGIEGESLSCISCLMLIILTFYSKSITYELMERKLR